MADRFCIASGDFNSTSIWSTSSGGAGGASVPGAADVAIFDTGAFAVTTSQAHVVDGLKMLVGFTGSLITGDFSFEIENTEMLIDAGTLTLPATAKFTLDGVIQTGGTINWGGDTFFKGNSMTITLLPGSDSLNDVELNGATISGANPVIVLGKFTLTNYNAINNTWKCEGDCDLIDTAASSSTGIIIFQGTNNQTLKGLVGGAILPGFQNNKTAGTLTIVDKILVRNSWLDNPTGTAVTVYQDGSKIVSEATGTISSKFKFFDLEVNSIGTCTLDDIVCRGELLLQASNSLVGNATIEGNIKKVDATYASGSTAAITMKGDRVQTLEDVVGAKAPNGLFTMAGKSQKLITDSDWQDSSASTPSAKLKLNSVLNLNGFDLTIEDVFDANGFLHDFDGGSVIVGTLNKNFGFQRGNANSMRSQTLKKRNQNIYSRVSNLGRRIMAGFSSYQLELTETLLLLGYTAGNPNTNSLGSAVCFDGVTTKAAAVCARSLSNTIDLEVGRNYIYEFPSGIKIDKIEVTSSSDKGFFSASDPTVDIAIEAWDGSFNAIGSTGPFTDGTAEVTKTITSTDQDTLFTRINAKVSSATSGVKLISCIKIFEVGGGEITLNFIDTGNITPTVSNAASYGRIEQIVDGVFDPASINSMATLVATTSDYVVPINFKNPSPISKFVINSTAAAGFMSGGDPTDCQIDAEGFNGSIWVPLGNTGLFTDAINLTKEIESTDKITVFEKGRMFLSSATSARRFIGEFELYVMAA